MWQIVVGIVVVVAGLCLLAVGHKWARKTAKPFKDANKEMARHLWWLPSGLFLVLIGIAIILYVVTA